MKKTAGMSLGLVIIFIALMSVVALAMIISSLHAFRTAQILPQMDGDFFSAEAAMNRAVPMIAAEVSTTSPVGTTAAANIRNAAKSVSSPTTNPTLIASMSAAMTAPGTVEEREANRNQLMLTALESDAAFMTALTENINYLLNGVSPDFIIPGRHPGQLGVPVPLGSGANHVGSTHFHLTESATVLNNPAEGFGAPAFVNLRRVNAPADNTVWVGVDVSVTGPANDMWVNVIPYITVISEAGATILSETITLPVQPFRLVQGDWNPNTVFNQGLGPGGFTTFIQASEGLGPSPAEEAEDPYIWLSGAGEGNPAFGVRGHHRNTGNMYGTHGRNAFYYTGRDQFGPDYIPSASVALMYSAEIPQGLRDFLRSKFP